MTNFTDSQYDCAQASTDLPDLLAQLEQLEAGATHTPTQQVQDQINHINNQIRFIRNKCDIPKES